MSKKGKLTELLTKDPPDVKKLFLYSRKKKFDSTELGKLAMLYHDLKKREPEITPLHVACWSWNKPEVVKTLVSEGWDVNTDVGDYGSPLCIALDNGNISLANVLIQLGANVEKYYRDGRTPMFSAITRKNKEKTCVSAIKLLLEAGVLVNAVIDYESKERALHIAVQKRLLSVTSFLLQKGANPNVRDSTGHAPIHVAVLTNCMEIVKLLVLHGIDLHIESDGRDTPLLVAVKLGHAEIIEELVKGGADVNKPCLNGGSAPFHVAVKFHKMEIVKLLVALGANPNKALAMGSTPLHVLAKKIVAPEKENNYILKDIAEYLVDIGANLNAADGFRNTPLQVAVTFGNLSLAKCFIKLGADFSIRDEEGNTIFHQVVPLNRDITNILLEFGGDYRAYNVDCFTPYHLALSCTVDLKYIKSFLKHGCPYDQDLRIWPKLIKKSKKELDQFFASEKNFFEGIKENNLELVKKAVMDGAVPSSCSEDMKYPLHFVALHGYNELLTFLLERNVQPNTLNKEGKSPLCLAASKGHYDSCHTLLRYGACYNYYSKKCPKTPRMIASDGKHDAVVDLFDSIDAMFRKARSKKRQVLKDLENKLKSDFDYLLYGNVIDIEGNTLLSTALQHERFFNVEEMMKMKIQYSLEKSITTSDA